MFFIIFAFALFLNIAIYLSDLITTRLNFIFDEKSNIRR